jgi:hypothetical protein
MSPPVSLAALVLGGMEANLLTPFMTVAKSPVVRAEDQSRLGVQPRSYAG